MAVMSRSRRGRGVALAACAAALCVRLGWNASFVSMGQGRSPTLEGGRRSFLASGMAGAAGAALLLGSEAAIAAEAPQKLEVVGFPDSRKDQNGLWVNTGKEVNKRAVYQREGQNMYLVYSDCDQFRFGDKADGSCEGFASEKKGKWMVDGQEASVKVKPVAAPAPVKKEMIKLGKDEDSTEVRVAKQNSLEADTVAWLTGDASDSMEFTSKEDEDSADKLARKLGGLSVGLTN
eukprot:TRINITY_DN75675_c0_g1_i1.p1 TRINITY_DN75675_c0_g1~~TRINITY_DN75675_c0_g1_i1.p1  ORF type:complete len:255 (+),score=61.70 TRINITY_DN75675_c0_g1_i1:66-767(+)